MWFNVIWFGVWWFDVQCIDVSCFDVKCFDVNFFDVSWICIVGKLREVKATPHPTYITVDVSIFLFSWLDLTWLDLPFNQLNFQVFVTTNRQSKRKKLSNRKTFLKLCRKKIVLELFRWLFFVVWFQLNIQSFFDGLNYYLFNKLFLKKVNQINSIDIWF
jgi:hypothetical protein